LRIIPCINMSSQIQTLQKQVAQLRQEASIQRIPVSQAVEELLNYMNQNSNSDALVVGVTPSENPFRDQKSCTIL
ncbi:guanine nucleotide-binding protein G(I)/G(S)/G(O) subunit gamma-7-like, partial [Liolophura sinensis]|uniref:guanine nucleotide-binding protein G(I)/G(S)/G(O) subunit gamma-7-like n=1 Tax=Liolophura sinensis TaxID=3198878 RepID=UPI0031592E1B